MTFKQIMISLVMLASGASQAFVLEFSNSDFSVNPEFNQVATFHFTIDVDGELVSGVYNDPVLNSVNYRVQGTLVNATPSSFPAFDLQRDIDGTEFYAQESSLLFVVSDTADLTDGLQASELVADTNGVIFTFNGREVDTERYHPALLVLREDGSGTLQNSNNIPVQSATNPTTVDFGEEYITQLSFAAGNLDLLQDNSDSDDDSDGGGAISPLSVLFLSLFAGLALFWRRVATIPA